jgi:hypothetical protein
MPDSRLIMIGLTGLGAACGLGLLVYWTWRLRVLPTLFAASIIAGNGIVLWNQWLNIDLNQRLEKAMANCKDAPKVVPYHDGIDAVPGSVHHDEH